MHAVSFHNSITWNSRCRIVIEFLFEVLITTYFSFWELNLRKYIWTEETHLGWYGGNDLEHVSVFLFKVSGSKMKVRNCIKKIVWRKKTDTSVTKEMWPQKRSLKTSKTIPWDTYTFDQPAINTCQLYVWEFISSPSYKFLV